MPHHVSRRPGNSRYYLWSIHHIIFVFFLVRGATRARARKQQAIVAKCYFYLFMFHVSIDEGFVKVCTKLEERRQPNAPSTVSVCPKTNDLYVHLQLPVNRS